jgi:hypothetical protein
MSEILIDNDASCEFIVSQLQKFTSNILAVKDGHRVLVYESLSTIPKNLQLVDVCRNELVETVEYHYRRSPEDELFVFFQAIDNIPNNTVKISNYENIQKENSISVKPGDIILQDSESIHTSPVNKILIL